MEKFAIPSKNLLFIIISLLVIILGYILMSGGGSDDPNVFSEDMFSFSRMVIAPLLIIIGFVLGIYFIMKKPKKD